MRDHIKAYLRRLIVDRTLDTPAGRKWLDAELARFEAMYRHPGTQAKYGGKR